MYKVLANLITPPQTAVRKRAVIKEQTEEWIHTTKLTGELNPQEIKDRKRLYVAELFSKAFFKEKKHNLCLNSVANDIHHT